MPKALIGFFSHLRDGQIKIASPVREAIYPNRQIILLAGCSSAEPVSSSDLQR